MDKQNKSAEEIQRYHISPFSTYGGEGAGIDADKDPEGDWVKFEDHQQAISKQQEANAELKNWKSEQIQVMAPLFKAMNNHPELKLGESLVNKSVEFIKDRNDLKKQNAELIKTLKQSQSLMRQDLQFRKHNGFTVGLVFLEYQIEENDKIIQSHESNKG